MEISLAPELLCNLLILYSSRPPYRRSCASDRHQLPVPIPTCAASGMQSGSTVGFRWQWMGADHHVSLKKRCTTALLLSVIPGKKIQSPVLSADRPTLSLNLNSSLKQMTHYYTLSVNLPDALDVNGCHFGSAQYK